MAIGLAIKSSGVSCQRRVVSNIYAVREQNIFPRNTDTANLKKLSDEYEHKKLHHQ